MMSTLPAETISQNIQCQTYKMRHHHVYYHHISWVIEIYSLWIEWFIFIFIINGERGSVEIVSNWKKKCGIDIRTNPYHPLDRNDLGFVFITYHKSLHLDNISNKDHVSNEGVWVVWNCGIDLNFELYPLSSFICNLLLIIGHFLFTNISCDCLFTYSINTDICIFYYDWNSSIRMMSLEPTYV